MMGDDSGNLDLCVYCTILLLGLDRNTSHRPRISGMSYTHPTTYPLSQMFDFSMHILRHGSKTLATLVQTYNVTVAQVHCCFQASSQCEAGFSQLGWN